MICSNHVDVSEGVRQCARCERPFCADCVVNILGRPFCATCKTEKLLDLQSGSDRSVLRLAPLGRRFAAQWVDTIVFMLPLFAVFGLSMFFMVKVSGRDAIPDSFVYVVFILLGVGVFGFIAYEALMLAWRGQTLGKMVLRIQVVRPDGSPISKGQAWGRALTRGVLIHVLGIANYLPALFTREKTCIHDLTAKTRVVSAD